MVLSLLTACAEPEIVGEDPPETEETAAALDADVGADASWARPADPVPRFSRGGPPALVEPADGWPTRVWVVAESEEGDAVRVVAERVGVRLLFWLARDGLAPVVRESLWVDADGRRVEDGGPGLYVPGGTPVVDGRLVLQGLGIPEVDLPIDPGWVDGVYQRSAPPSLADGPDVVIAEGAPLRDDDGRVLLTLPGPHRTPGAVQIDVDPDTGAHFIELRDDTRPLARGWVAEDDAIVMEDWFFYSSFRCGFGIGDWQPVFGPTGAVVAGTELYDAPGGDLVGVIRWDTELALAPDEDVVDGLSAFSVVSPFGAVVVWGERSD